MEKRGDNMKSFQNGDTVTLTGGPGAGRVGKLVEEPHTSEGRSGHFALVEGRIGAQQFVICASLRHMRLIARAEPK